jgi:hypothetical protein
MSEAPLVSGTNTAIEFLTLPDALRRVLTGAPDIITGHGQGLGYARPLFGRREHSLWDTLLGGCRVSL